METKSKHSSTKLVDISTQYSKFNKNQVLTETQLNGFLDYFDDQDRLSRTSLSGVGIVCGFQVSYDTTLKSIKITQGRGVTTDGDLVALQNPSQTEQGKKDTTLKSIELSSKTFKFYKKFLDDTAKYDRFIGADKKQIELWELHEEDDNAHTSLSSFPNLKNMVVLLYLESYSKEGDLCTKLSCDNQGIEQVSRLRVLLTSVKNAKYILSKDSIYKKHDWYETYITLPEVSAKRVVLNCDNTKTYKQLKSNYYNAIKSNNTVTKLGEGLDAILAKFNQTSVSSYINRLFNFNENAIPVDFQYRYDVLKDLIDTYNEIKSTLLNLNVHCCPTIGAFPKHLMLGRIEEIKPYLSLRHEFYKSPIIGCENKEYQKALHLLQKVKELCINFLFINKGSEIKITPSLDVSELSKKTIPFYYKVDDPILKQWSYEKTKELRSRFNLSYHRQNLVSAPAIQHPLDYNLDHFNFYRIEGIQGKMYRDALDQILKIKKDKGLSFDVKVLSVETANKSVDIKEYKCQFEDLKILLAAWRAEQDCVLSEVSQFLSGFDTKKAGDNLISKKKGYDRMVVAASATGMERIHSYEEELKSDARKKMYEKRMAYGRRKNIVEEKLTHDEGALGVYVKKAFKENKGGSANDIMAAITRDLTAVSNTDTWKEKAELKEFVLKDITEVLVHSYILDNEIPTSILEINEASLVKYKLTIDQLCTYVKNLQMKYKKVELNDGSKQIIGLLINQLSTVCCSAKKLEILLKEIETRKKEILIQTQLSEFVKKHPGLEHRAGVVPGGTFVMAYVKEDADNKATYQNVTLELEFLEQPNIDDDGLDGDKGQIQLWNSKLSTKFAFLHRVTKETQNPMEEVVFIGKDIEETVSNLSTFLNVLWRRAGAINEISSRTEKKKLIIEIKDRSIRKKANFIQFFNPAIVGKNTKIYFEENTIVATNTTTKNTVVADFYLPYMCCTDCAPVNFIIPKEPVKLSLPKKYICLEEGVEVIPIPFDVSPSDAKIKANVPEGKESGLTYDANNKPVFDASLTDPSLHGKVIAFTANDEETDCAITVYPDVALSVTTSVEYHELNTVAIVTYKVSEVYANLKHQWDFGNGTTVEITPSSSGEVKEKYALPVNADNIVKPSLRISNGFCEKVIPIEPIVFESPVDVSLNIVKTYCLNTRATSKIKIPFTDKNPSTGTIEIAGGAINGLNIENDNLIVDPQKFKDFDKPIRFTLERQITNAIITIGAIKEFSIIGDEGQYYWEGNNLYQLVYLTVKMQGGDNGQSKYIWKINGDEAGKKKNIEHGFLLKKEASNSYEIMVTITDPNGCVSTKKRKVKIPYPKFTMKMEDNISSFCLNDDRNYSVLVNPLIDKTPYTGNGIYVDANGQVKFTPIRTNMTAPGAANLGIAGDTLLTLKLKAASKARFEWKVEQKQLFLTNTSEVADKYIWNVAGQEIIRTNRAALKFKVDTFQESVIDVSLTSMSSCGEDTFTITGIKVREEVEVNTNCISETLGRIEEDRSKISMNVDVSTNTRNKIVIPTVRLYDTVLAAPPSVLNGGDNNSLKGFTKLFSGTAAEIIKNRNNTYILGVLSKLYIAQAKLFLNMIHCQPHTVLENDKRVISTITSSLRASLVRIKASDIQFDMENDLKNFFIEYSRDNQVVTYMRAGVKKLIVQIL
ncbi:hypothetical protein [Pseudotenacibaculum haliotis]|uniref:Ig-like domain-containing protein n=1 Tax=Pseudotenacibaculum haliotis TaxID=1862138 RepID=A0ABW5LVL1_9FLAO